MNVNAMNIAGLDQAKAPPGAIRIYQAGIPDYVEAALETLYECPMTTLLRFRQYYPLDDAATYVSWEGGILRSAIVFRVEARAVRVYNEQITLPAAELDRFVRAVFLHYPEVRRISLYAVEANTDELAFPYQRQCCLEDITLQLPDTVAAYDALLSKNMSSKIKRSNKKLFSDFSRVCKHVVEPGSARAEAARRIIEFNRMRMARKGLASYHTDEETAKLLDMVERYGLVFAVSIGGELCAGMIMFRIGSTISMHTIAHHPDYDAYNLGTLCCYYGIVDAIQSGARQFNFGWGRYEYKYRLLGKHKDLHRIDIYRTPLALAGDIRTLCRRRYEAQRRSFKLWMADPGLSNGRFARALWRAMHAARAVRDRFS